MIPKKRQLKTVPKVSQRRLYDDNHPRSNSSSFTEELDNEKRRRVDSEEDNEAVNEGSNAEIEDGGEYDTEESPLMNSLHSNSVSSSSITSPALSFKLANLPGSTNDSIASSITRSDHSNDSTIMLEDHIDAKHLEIGLFYLLIISFSK